jgi:hypothetical protein
MLPPQYKKYRVGMTMNDAARTLPHAPAAAGTQPEPAPRTAMSRIKLALLDQYAASHEQAGSDPYNTTAGRAKPDQWRGNARRI